MHRLGSTVKWLRCWLLACAVCTPASAQVDVDAYLKRDKFERVKISPSRRTWAARRRNDSVADARSLISWLG
jgi:hypothetical protein